MDAGLPSAACRASKGIVAGSRPRSAVRAAGDLGIDYLTIFSFSSENWSRPPTEVRELMGLLRRFVRNDLADLHKSNVRVRIIGERDDLDPEIGRLLQEAEELTRQNTGLVLVVAFNYGGRQEIARAARRALAEVAAGRLKPEAITAEALGGYLDAPDVPDPDLIIRTSGEQRLVQLPDAAGRLQRTRVSADLLARFRLDRALEDAILEFHRRERRFGGLVARTGS